MWDDHKCIQYFKSFESRLVANSGNPSDAYHLGKLIIQGFKDAPEYILQIDGATDEQITFGETLEKSIRCAYAFRKMGLTHGDVVVIMAPNHIAISIPFYAAFYEGLIAAAIDQYFSVSDLVVTFNKLKPKVVFCQSEKLSKVQESIKQSNLSCKIITYDESNSVPSLQDLMEQEKHQSIEDFKASDFDPQETVATVVGTSGTTGATKYSALSHKAFSYINKTIWCNEEFNFPTPTKLVLVTSPLQWVTAQYIAISAPIIRCTRLMFSYDTTREIVCRGINKYKPTYMLISPNVITNLLKTGEGTKCDITCFDHIYVGGNVVFKEVLENIKAVHPKCKVGAGYGTSEFGPALFGDFPLGSLGKPSYKIQHKIVDLNTLQEIREPNIPGELWIKTPAMFKGYYNDQEATDASFSEDGWFRTGDLFVYDEDMNLFYSDRLKLLLKYKMIHISPVEIEKVIIQHPGVSEAVVFGIPHMEYGDLPVACVVRKNGSTVTAQEIKDIVKNNLSDAKQLRGGVIFFKKLPLTTTTKLDRRALKKMAMTMERE